MSKYLQAPIYKIMRNCNREPSQWSLLYDRKDVFMNGVKLLEDPKHDRKLILIGTMNSSTLLADRTQKILEIAKPDCVLVETSNRWYETLNQMGAKNAKSNLDIQKMDQECQWESGDIGNNLRTLIFKSKYYPWLAVSRMIFPFTGEESSVIQPGLEAFRVADWAVQNKKDVLFAGKMFNDQVKISLHNEKRMHLIPFLWRFMFKRKTSTWVKEYHALANQCSLHGLEAFAETMDDEKISWLIKYYQNIIPYQTKIFVEDEDVRLFDLIYENMSGKVNLALVNMWHLPGIENHWRHTTQTETFQEFINPIGDFDITRMRIDKEKNEFFRRDKSTLAKTEPAVTSDYLFQYNKQNTEAERERHVFFHGYDDPELEHGLFNNENKNVKNLPYKQEHH